MADNNYTISIGATINKESYIKMIKDLESFGKAANIPISINSEALDKALKGLSFVTDASGKITKSVQEYNVGLAKSVQITSELNKVTNELEIKSSKFHDESQKLANQMADARGKSAIRIQNEQRQLEETQAKYVNKVMEDNYKLSQNADLAKMNSSDLARKLTLEEEQQRVAVTTEAQKNIERMIVGGNEIIAEQQKRTNSTNAFNYEEVWAKAYKDKEANEIKTLESEKQTTLEIEKQIALYKEQLAIKMQNAKTTYGKYYDSNAMSSISNGANSLNASNFLNTAGLKDATKQIDLSFDKSIAKSKELRKEATLAMKESDGFITTLAKDAGKMVAWTVVGGALFGTIHAIQDAVKTVTDLNSALTTIQMTMNLTTDDIGTLTSSAQNMSKEMGISIDQVLNAFKVYANAHETVASILEKTKADIMLATASGMDTSQTTDAIQGTMNQFELTAKGSATRIADTLEKVSQNMAFDFKKGIQEITDGIKVTGVVAKDAGFSLERYEAVLGTIIERTRLGGSTVAQGLKMTMARMGRANTGDATTADINKTETAYKAIGINLRDSTTGQFRDIPAVLDDLYKKWDNLTTIQKNYIAETSSSVRQINIFKNMMDGWGDATKKYTQALDAAGTAEENQKKHLESIQGKYEQFQATIKNMWLNTINSQAIKDLVDLGTIVVDLVGKFGIFNTAIVVLNISLIALGKMNAVNAGLKTLGNVLIGVTTVAEGLNLTLATLWPLLAVGAIFAAVKAFDALYISVDKQKEVVSTLTTKYTDLKTKIDELHNIKNPSQAQKDNLKLLQDEYKVQNDLLYIETQRLARKELLGEGVLGSGVKGNVKNSKDDIQTTVDDMKQVQAQVDTWKKYNSQQDLSQSGAYNVALMTIQKDKEHLVEIENKLIESRKTAEKYKSSLGGNAPKETQGIIDSTTTLLGITNKYTGSLDNNTKSQQQNTQVQKNNAQTIDQQTKSAKQLDAAVTVASKSITELNKIQKELNTNHKLSAANMTIIAQKYPELLKYAGDEKKLKEELTKKVAEETHAYKQAIQDKLFASTDFYNKVLNGNETLTQELKRAYGNDASNFKTFNDMKIQANALLLNALGQQWSQYYATQAQALQALVNAPLNYNLTKDLGMSSVIGGQKVLNSPEIQAQLQAQQNLRQQQANQAKALLDSMNAASKAAAKTTGAIKLRSGNDTKAKKAKAPASQSAPKAEPSALLDKDRYAQLNMELERTDTLLGKVKAEEEMYKDDDAQQKQYLASLNQEQKLLERKQENLHNINNEYRIERAELEKKLSKKGIAFSGSGDTAYINNLSDDTDKLLNQVRKHQNDKNKTYYNQLNAEYTSYLEKVKRFEEIQKTIGTNQQQFYSVEKDIKTLDQDREAIAQKQVKNSEQLLTDLKDSYNYQINKQQDSLDTQNKSWDAQISQYDAIVKLDETHYGLLNQVTSEQQAINDQLKASKESYGYLNEETRKLLFNEDDYNKLSSKLTTIANDAGSLFTDYQSKISSLNEDNIYQLSQITNEFQRQYDLKMKEYDIAKKDLDTAKAKAELANVQNEHNVRLFQDGQWNWVADPKAVKDAMQKVSDAQVASTTAQSEYDQLVIEQKTQALADEIKLEEDGAKAKLDATVNAWKKISAEFEKPAKSIKDVLADIAANGTPELKKTIADVSAALALLGIDLGITTATTQNNNSGSNSHPLDDTSWANNPSSSSGGGSGGTIQDQINDSLIGGHNFGSSDSSSNNGSSSSTSTSTSTNINSGSNYADAIRTAKNGYADGGETPSTGLHWLDGTKEKPERVLDPSQTQDFNKLVSMLPSVNSVFEKAMGMFSLPKMSNISKSTSTDNSKIINVHVDKIVTPDSRDFLNQLNNIVATHG